MSEQRAVAEVDLDDLRVQVEELNTEENILGSGAYGVVYEATVDGKKCIAKKLHNILLQAIKKYPQGQDDSIVKKFRQECKIMSQLKHPNVVGFVGVHYGRDSSDISLIMERLDCDLADFVRKNPDTRLCDRLHILYDVSKGLDYLHSQKPPLIHRDLTAPNILLTETLKAKIGDLGVSRYLNPSDVCLTTNPGNLLYMPPESQVPSPSYTEKLDIFSFGNLIIHTVIGELPRVYNIQSVFQMAVRKVQGKTELFRRDDAVHHKMGKFHCLYPLVVRCLHDSADNRPQASEVRSSLKELCTRHPRMLKMTLLEASETGNVEVVEELLECGADPNQLAMDNVKNSALHYASRNGHEEVVRVLLLAKAAVDTQNKYGETPLWTASCEGHHRCVELLIEAGAKVDVSKMNGFTALIVASQNGHCAVVRLLLKAKADVDVKTNGGSTALTLASQEGHCAVVRILLEAKADVNIKTNVRTNTTALYFASMNGHEEVVRVLLSARATVNIQNKSGQTPLYTASRNGHQRCVELLIEAGAIVDVPEESGETPLWTASFNGQHRCVELLIEAGANVDVPKEDRATPLYVAAQNCHIKVVEMLIGAKCQVDLQRKDGWTALHGVCERGHLKIVENLTTAHANINARTKFNHTPLMLAAYHSHSSIVELLLSKGADTTLEDIDGKTAYDYACEKGHNQICEKLMSQF